MPKEEQVRICNEVPNRECGFEGVRTCSQEYETGRIIIYTLQMEENTIKLFNFPNAVCETVYEEHEVKEDVSNCEMENVRVCNVDQHGEVV